MVSRNPTPIANAMNDILATILLILSIKGVIFFFLSVFISVFYVVFRNWRWARIWAICGIICLTVSAVGYGVMTCQPEAAEQPHLSTALLILNPSISLLLSVSLILYLLGRRGAAYTLTALGAALIFADVNIIIHPNFIFLAMGMVFYAAMLFIATLIMGLIVLLKKGRAEGLRWGYCCFISLIYIGIRGAVFPIGAYEAVQLSRPLLALIAICPIFYLCALEIAARPLITPQDKNEG